MALRASPFTPPLFDWLGYTPARTLMSQEAVAVKPLLQTSQTTTLLNLEFNRLIISQPETLCDLHHEHLQKPARTAYLSGHDIKAETVVGAIHLLQVLPAATPPVALPASPSSPSVFDSLSDTPALTISSLDAVAFKPLLQTGQTFTSLDLALKVSTSGNWRHRLAFITIIYKRPHNPPPRRGTTFPLKLPCEPFICYRYSWPLPFRCPCPHVRPVRPS